MNSSKNNLPYTCLLIPASPSTKLKGDLADYLVQWLEQISVSHGWQVVSTFVHSDYFQWSVNVPSPVPPGSLVQIVRSETSALIFSHFKSIKQGDVLDFWAPGYLVTLGEKSQSKEMIEQFMHSAHQFNPMLAGDSSTDAPLPNVQKNKQKKK